MGFDTSYHAVDIGLIEKQLIPYILGQGDIEAVVTRAVAAAATRFRANAWGLALTELELDEEQPFNTSLHVWGRPFLIAGDDGETVSRAVDEYLAARDLAAVDALAKAHAQKLVGKLPPTLQPEGEGEPLDAAGVRWRMDLLRASAEKMRKGGGTVVGADGEEHDAEGLLVREIPLSLVEVAAYTRPGWMTRGFWPTQIDSLAELFGEPEPLLAPFRKAFPDIEFFSEAGISENYMVGGWVNAADVPALHARVRDARDEILAHLEEEEWDDEDAALEVQKLEEALGDAVRRKLPFAEATEIYSGPGGVIC